MSTPSSIGPFAVGVDFGTAHRQDMGVQKH
jgi:hypothetical protein